MSMRDASTNRINRNALSILVALTVSVMLVACGDGNPEELIIGKWKSARTTDSLEFFEDGTLAGSIFVELKSAPGRYEWGDETHLRMAWNASQNQSIALPLVVAIEVTELTEDKLVLTIMDDDGQPGVFTYERFVAGDTK